MELMVEEYKQTEVGLIPVDWEVKSCSDLCVKIQDGTHFSPTIGGNDYLYITSKNIRFGFLDIRNVDRIDSAQHNQIYKRCDVRFGDLLLTKDGANTGNAALNTIDEEFSLLSSVAFLRFDTAKYNAEYFLQHILSDFGQQQVKEAMTGNAITRLTLAKIKKLRFPVTTHFEQTAIATALSDADALICSLEKLIAKKRNIKQGAMQKLLEPKEGWEVKKLGEIAEVKSGKRLPLGKELTENVTAHPYIRILDMNNNGISSENIKYVPEEVFPSIKNYRIYKEDIYISVAGTLGLVGRIPASLDGANLTENANKLTNIKCNGDYLLSVMKSDLIQNKIEAERTLGAQPKLALVRIRNFEIPLPPSEEQTRIANILSDIDSEITALETKLEKYRNVKLGMMQTLLTGKIRLV